MLVTTEPVISSFRIHSGRCILGAGRPQPPPVPRARGRPASLRRDEAVRWKDSDVRLQNRRVLGVTVSALGAALVLAGCGAGQITQTDTQQPAVNGTYAQVKTL